MTVLKHERRMAALARLVILFILPAACAFSANAQKELSISQVQGDKNLSSYTGESVRVSGIVTARTRTGFFIQTPDDKTDANPATSEGIFVFSGSRAAPPSDAALGNLVSVTGTVEEFRRESDALNLTTTNISFRQSSDQIRVIAKALPLPKPVMITVKDFKPNTLDQLEKYEGMIVAVAEMTVVSPTGGREDNKTGLWNSDGVFFGVVKGIPRPFREPGIDIREVNGSPEGVKLRSQFPKLAVFDGNPETIRVDSNEQTGSKAIDVPTHSTIANIAGVLHYAFGKYTILTYPVNTGLSISGGIKPTPMPVPSDRQFSIVGMNIENFFDDQDDPGIKETVVSPEAFQRRLKKISLAVRELMKMPDVIGAVEIENLAALKRLADRINADAVADGKPDPKYAAYLVEGNDGRGIDNGFLVKASRVKVLETKQFGKDETYANLSAKNDPFLNDRPPLMIRASIIDPKTNQPFEFTVVVIHLKSYSGYSVPKQQDDVRTKKRMQAEYLARWVDARQKTNSAERIVLIGDLNSYQFSDGVLDMIGTIKGKPAAKDEVLNASPDLVNPDLIDLVDAIDPRQRYSYLFDGNAQTLDHMLITETFRKHVNGFGFLRVNTDFPESFRNDDTRSQRFSDHDPAVAYFTFDDVTKK